MTSKKQLIINMVAQISSLLVNLFISFYITPYIISKIGIEAYGFVGLSNEFIGYAQLVTVALNSMAGRFITIKLHENDDEGANRYFNSVLMANIVLGLSLTVIGVLVIVFIDKLISVPSNLLFDVRMLWALMFLNFIMSIVTSVFGVATFAKNKLYLSSVRQIEAQVLRVVILLLCMYFLPPYTWYIGMAALIFTSVTSWYNYVYTKKLLPTIKLRKKYFDFKTLKELLASGIWNTVSKLGGLLSSGLDLLITNKFVGAIAMGTLSLAKTVPNVILSVFGNIASVFAPELTISYAKKNYKDIKEQLNFSIKLLGFFSCIPMAILFAYGAEFYGLWAPTQDPKILQLLSIITCFAFVFSLPLEPLWNVFTTVNKVKQSSIYLLCSSILSIIIVFIGLNFIDNKLYQLVLIAGVSTCLSVVKSLIFLPMYGAKCLKFKLNTFYVPIIKNTISVLVVTIFSFFIKSILIVDSWYMLFACCIITAIFACFINCFIILNKNERKRCFIKLKKVMIRIMIELNNLVVSLIKKICTKFVKTNDYYILFETEGDFCDNGRALYEYMIDNDYNRKYHITWIVTNPQKYINRSMPNVEFINRNSKNLFAQCKFYKAINRTKYFFFTHPYWLKNWKKDQVVINLWHGTPLKARGRDLSSLFDYLTVTSDESIMLCNKFFQVKKEQCIMTGSARNDLLFEYKEDIRNKLQIKLEEKIILCMTTFKRKDDQKDCEDDEKFVIPTIERVEQLEQLNKYLIKNNTKLLLKIHHLQYTKILEKMNLSNIIYIEDSDLDNMNIQLYHLIGQADALLTDYSSVFFDYLLLNRPIGFFVSSLESYKEKRGFLVDDITKYMCGEKIKNVKELYQFFDHLNKGIDNYKKERKMVLNKINYLKDNNSRKRILEYLHIER